jgi:hypothetical protein
MKGLGRVSPSSLDHLKVLSFMADILQEQLDSKRASVERELSADVSPVVERIKEKLAANGRTLGGKEKNGAAKGAPRKMLMGLIREVVKEEMERRGAKADETRQPLGDAAGAQQADGEGEGEEGGFLREDAFQAIQRRYEEEKAKAGVGAAAAAEEDAGGEEEGDEEDADAPEPAAAAAGENEVKNDENQLMVFDFSNKKPKSKKPKGKGKPTWKSQLLDLLKKIGDLEKVTADRPSTGPFGNFGIVSAVSRVSDADAEWNFVGRSVMGKKLAGVKSKGE